MRKKIVAGNWKMNKEFSEGIELVQAINKSLVENKPAQNSDEIGVVMCTPYIHLAKAVQEINSPILSIGGQNLNDNEKGAYTGEISASMLNSIGVNYVIVGHSERRAYYKESHEMLAKKVDQALSNGLKPIFCCGEVLEEREANNQENIVRNQLEDSVFHLNENEFRNLVIAYEPVWAIGTGKTASSDQAQEMHNFIRNLIKEKYNDVVADGITILYGGSCNPKNAKELFANPDVDGGLIGGASLKADDFIKIIHSY